MPTIFWTVITINIIEKPLYSQMRLYIISFNANRLKKVLFSGNPKYRNSFNFKMLKPCFIYYPKRNLKDN